MTIHHKGENLEGQHIGVGLRGGVRDGLLSAAEGEVCYVRGL